MAASSVTYHSYSFAQARQSGKTQAVSKSKAERSWLKMRAGANVVLPADTVKYKASLDNPIQGSEFECAGFVEHFDPDCINVTWDNSTKNVYEIDELQVIGYRKEDITKVHKYKQGTMVYLASSHYTPKMNNPCLGSRYQCAGEIIKSGYTGKHGKFYVKVMWENGSHNSYTFREDKPHLIEYTDDQAIRDLFSGDPNLSFKAQSEQMSGIAQAVARHINLVLEGGDKVQEMAEKHKAIDVLLF